MSLAAAPAALHVGALTGGSALAVARARGVAIARVDLGAGTPPLEVAALPGVRYVPSALETGQGVQVLDDGVMPVEAVFDDFTPGFVRDHLLARDRVHFDEFAESAHAGPVCILGNVFSRNFTHWHEELMKVMAIEHARIDCAYVVSELPAYAYALLAAAGVPAERVLEVRAPTRFAQALFSTPVSYRNVADYPGVLLALRERLLAIADPAAPADGRWWLDRGQQTRLGRKLVNDDEVQPLLERYGFTRVDLGALPVPRQVGLAARARVFAGTHGSGFVHTQLMPRGANVVEAFSPIYLNPTYTEIYRVLGHRYSQLCATNTPLLPYLHGGDVWIDVQQLDLALRAAARDADAR